MVSSRSTVTTFSLGMVPCGTCAWDVWATAEMTSRNGMVEDEVYLVVFGLIVGAMFVLGWKHLLNIPPTLTRGRLRQSPLPVQEHQLCILTWIPWGLVKVMKLLYVSRMHWFGIGTTSLPSLLSFPVLSNNIRTLHWMLSRGDDLVHFIPHYLCF